MAASGVQTTATTRVVLRLLVYYAVLIGGGILVWSMLPHMGAAAPTSLETVFGGGPPGTTKGSTTQPLDEVTLAITVSVAMLAAILLAIPVAWVYLLTRAKRG